MRLSRFTLDPSAYLSGLCVGSDFAAKNAFVAWAAAVDAFAVNNVGVTRCLLVSSLESRKALAGDLMVALTGDLMVALTGDLMVALTAVSVAVAAALAAFSSVILFCSTVAGVEMGLLLVVSAVALGLVAPAPTSTALMVVAIVDPDGFFTAGAALVTIEVLDAATVGLDGAADLLVTTAVPVVVVTDSFADADADTDADGGGFASFGVDIDAGVVAGSFGLRTGSSLLSLSSLRGFLFSS